MLCFPFVVEVGSPYRLRLTLGSLISEAKQPESSSSLRARFSDDACMPKQALLFGISLFLPPKEGTPRTMNRVLILHKA
uniref:Uncharacterized protein n=1 Tax=Triticum urartu TaxID=4572 RepID=A0A8R7U355_TRIUA